MGALTFEFPLSSKLSESNLESLESRLATTVVTQNISFADQLRPSYLTERSFEMTADNRKRFSSDQPPSAQQSDVQIREYQPFGGLDVTKRSRFELLSAYLDGEVTPDEHRMVKSWLTDDPGVQCLYQRLLSLRRGLQTLPTPHATVSVEQTVESVMIRLSQRFRLTLLAGAGTAAALLLAGLSGLLEGQPGFWEFAGNKQLSPDSSDVLEIALDQPAIEIPQAPMALDTFSDMTQDGEN